MELFAGMCRYVQVQEYQENQRRRVVRTSSDVRCANSSIPGLAPLKQLRADARVARLDEVLLKAAEVC